MSLTLTPTGEAGGRVVFVPVKVLAIPAVPMLAQCSSIVQGNSAPPLLLLWEGPEQPWWGCLLLTSLQSTTDPCGTLLMHYLSSKVGNSLAALQMRVPAAAPHCTSGSAGLRSAPSDQSLLQDCLKDKEGPLRSVGISLQLNFR